MWPFTSYIPKLQERPGKVTRWGRTLTLTARQTLDKRSFLLQLLYCWLQPSEAVSPPTLSGVNQGKRPPEAGHLTWGLNLWAKFNVPTHLSHSYSIKSSKHQSVGVCEDKIRLHLKKGYIQSHLSLSALLKFGRAKSFLWGHCRMFSSIPLVTTKNVRRHC